MNQQLRQQNLKLPPEVQAKIDLYEGILTKDQILASLQAENRIKYELGLRKPPKYVNQSDDLWEYMFKVIIDMDEEKNIERQQIPSILEMFGSLEEEGKQRAFIRYASERNEEVTMRRVIFLNIIEDELVDKSIDEIYQQLPDNVKLEYIKYLDKEGELNESVTAQLRELEQFEAQSFIGAPEDDQETEEGMDYKAYREKNKEGFDVNQLYGSGGAKRSYTNEAMTKDRLAELLNETQTIKDEVGEIPETGYNALLEAVKNTDGIGPRAPLNTQRGSFQSVSRLIEEKGGRTAATNNKPMTTSPLGSIATATQAPQIQAPPMKQNPPQVADSDISIRFNNANQQLEARQTQEVGQEVGVFQNTSGKFKNLNIIRGANSRNNLQQPQLQPPQKERGTQTDQ
jgi:hypothetical protein